MFISECKVGQRVICIKPFAGYASLVGMTGTIVAIRDNEYNRIGVDFDEDFRGKHGCGGRAINGRWGDQICLELLSIKEIISYADFLNPIT